MSYFTTSGGISGVVEGHFGTEAIHPLMLLSQSVAYKNGGVVSYTSYRAVLYFRLPTEHLNLDVVNREGICCCDESANFELDDVTTVHGIQAWSGRICPTTNNSGLRRK